MGTNKINKSTLYKWVLWVFIGWGCSETIYQFYIRSEWMKNGEYQWEYYVVKRNNQRLLTIQKYFKNYSSKYFNISYRPNEGSLDSLPDDVKNCILDFKEDLLSGIDFFKNRQHFSLHYEKIDSTSYEIVIDAGTTFKASYNGYDFEATMTNSASSTKGCALVISPDIYVCREYLKQREYIRPTPFILRYNCNSYDLLILKLFR
ncbi:MAG: hypothetical protein HY840_05995 [Bacteroidetes bacterium]|nr:hypothetical protein [Bacteroidota bacterium]